MWLRHELQTQLSALIYFDLYAILNIGGDDMKKKIIIAVFSALILITSIFFVIVAIKTYNSAVENDVLAGLGVVMAFIIGGYVVFYEFDLFYTVYYFLLKPKTIMKSILNVLSNVTLLLIFFADYLAHVFYVHFNIFKEDWLFPIALFYVYVILRIACVAISIRQSSKEK